MFADKDLEECGIPKIEEKPDFSKVRGPPDCTKQKCILGKYNLLKDENIDFDAVSTFLDKWAEKNPAFKPTVETAKSRCLGELPGPPQICEADKMVFCIGTTMFVECPAWEDNENCTKLKNHVESCKAAIPKPL
ncbi:uncharacterized protein [Epargyreus clarus]|uniref:uncharacterized protein n=1 Tax=Epargyreus clarus TaxID=520877 RepID=UPI003C305D09